MNERERQEIEVFNLAIELPSPEERAAYLDRACAGDAALRQKVEALLRVHADADHYFGTVPKDVRRASLSGLAEAAQAANDARLNAVSEKPGDRIGHYKLLEKIGEGGMGVVYMAEQEEPVRRRVALKIIKLGMDTKRVVARFEAERQALALMDHPNIAKVLDGGATESGRLYFVMELVQGVPITEFCDKNRLSAEERVKLFLPVCQAIQSAHQKGIIHRDLKPTNILVALNPDGSGMPMVIDFGVAKATNQKLTEKTLYTNYAAMIGTPAYMSPEQAEMSGLDVDTRSDIYGLGVLLYELLTGTTPFPEQRLRSASYNEMQRIILEEEPERPSTRLSTLRGEQRSAVARNRGGSELTLGRAFPGDLDWIVMKCLEKDRVRRYETANGLARDLQRHLNNEPVVARPPSGAYRVRKFVRRNRATVTAAALVVAALVLGTFVSTWQAIRATRFGHEAERARASEARQRRRAEAGEQFAQRLLYGANMNLAQQAWEQNNFGRLRELLQETATYPARGFEWYYWQRQMHLDVNTLRGHADEIHSVAFSPDGQRIVTGSWDRTAKVWDAASGTNLLTLKGHRDMIGSVDWSPDGRRIATASYDGTAKVWDAASGMDLLTLTGHSTVVYVAVFSPDRRRIATGGMDATAKAWDAAQAAGGSANYVWSVMEATVKVWDAADGKQLLTLRGHSAEVYGVAFSPDGERIVTGSADGTAKLWDAADGKELLALKGHSTWVNSVAFSPDGRRIVTGSGDYTAKVWEAATAQQVDAWQREEQAATERLATLRREQAAAAEHERALRTQTPGAIKQWLVLAPIGFERGGAAESGAVALAREQVPQEAGLRPRAGDRVSVGASGLVWTAVQQDDYLIDFNQILGHPTEWSVAYAVSYIESETAQTGLLMKVGSDDQAKIYLNGKEIYRNEEARPCVPDQDVVTGVGLRAGLNAFVFKVVNEARDWQGPVRFADAAGQPVKGIRATLTPP